MRNLQGKKVLITGAASGIGRALALALAHAGADLYLLDIDEENLAATAREAQACGGAVKTLVCDLTQSAAISAAVSAVLAEWGALNILVNNAGIAHYGATHEMSAAQWERLMSLNLLAPIQITRAFIPTLLAQDEAHVLNICSIFGLVPLRRGAAYQVSKFGLVGLSAALRAEYGRDLGVTALCPGFVRTTLLDTLASDDSGNPRSPVPDWLAARPEKVAAVAIRAIRANRALVVIPPLARFIWWIARLSPGRLSCWVARHSPRLVGWLANPRWRNKRAAG
jgi:short-subunit dehydrogenase